MVTYRNSVPFSYSKDLLSVVDAHSSLVVKEELDKIFKVPRVPQASC